MRLIMSHDLRSAPFGTAHGVLYRSAIDQSVWAEQAGFDVIMTHERHCDDGYMPSPLIFSAAVAGATKRIRIEVKVALLPLYDPIHFAEDCAVLDLVSEGRADVVVAVGYRKSEYELFGVDYESRGKLMDEAVDVVKKAWSGEPFEYRGRMVQISPRPYRRPHPPLYFGGNSKAAARRAAREGDGFFTVPPALMEFYREETRRLGKPPGVEEPPGRGEGMIAFVAEDPAKAWEQVGPYCLFQHNAYFAAFAPDAEPATTREELAAFKSYLVVSPDECISLAHKHGGLTFQPLAGGLPPELAQESLDLIERKVLPALKA